MIANSREDRMDDKNVLINRDTGRIWINGEELPFLVEVDGPSVTIEDGMGVVHIPLFVIASEIIIVDTKGERA